tara:strand:+ start:4077 stop:5294 length:1218 start_codon:yes stop_codon:yes gene_type:complete
MAVITFRVRHASDRRDAILSTTVTSKYLTRDQNIDIYAQRSNINSSKEPTIESFTNAIKKRLKIVEICRNHPKRSIVLRVGKCGYMINLRKDKVRYSVNGIYANLDILVKAIARTIFRSCYINGDGEEADEQLDDYLIRCIEMPENITYVMENRAPYRFYHRENNEITEHTCRLGVMQIAPKLFALELSSGVWGEINIRDLNTFVNTYANGHKKGKWHMISPQELWLKTTGEKPTNAQTKVMKEFLKQNRKPEDAEKKAMQLFESMVEKHDVIKKGKFETTQGKKVLAMYIRGKLADWMVIDNQSKRGIQDVSTYVLTKRGNTSGISAGVKEPVVGNKDDYYWAGPICIDNLSSGAAVGDQFAARAMAAMNDTMLVKLVSTVSRYLSGEQTEGQTTVRLDWDAMP